MWDDRELNFIFIEDKTVLKITNIKKLFRVYKFQYLDHLVYNNCTWDLREENSLLFVPYCLIHRALGTSFKHKIKADEILLFSFNNQLDMCIKKESYQKKTKVSRRDIKRVVIIK